MKYYKTANNNTPPKTTIKKTALIHISTTDTFPIKILHIGILTIQKKQSPF